MAGFVLPFDAALQARRQRIAGLIADLVLLAANMDGDEAGRLAAPITEEIDALMLESVHVALTAHAASIWWRRGLHRVRVLAWPW